MPADFLRQQPIGRAAQRRERRIFHFRQGKSRDRRVPNRRETRLHVKAARFVSIDHQAVELLLRFHAIGMVRVKAQNIQRHDGVHHGRIDGAQAVRLLEMLDHPFAAFGERVTPDEARAHALPDLQEAVERRKQLRQLKNRGSRSRCMGAPGKYSSSRVKPAGTGRCGFAACTIESGITIARVHDDI